MSYLREKTNSLGKITSYNKSTGNIQCEVGQNKLRRLLQKNKGFFDTDFKFDQENVVYIIKDFEFIHRLHIDTKASLIFIDCQFVDGIDIENADLIYLSNNRHFLFNEEEFEEPYITTKNVNTIILCDEKLDNYNVDNTTEFNVDLAAKAVYLDNSTIKSKLGNITITTDELKTISSKIEGEDVKIVSTHEVKSDSNSSIVTPNLHWYVPTIKSKINLDFKKIDYKKPKTYKKNS